jgi:tRNA (guanine-N7-)-methyltransferase
MQILDVRRLPWPTPWPVLFGREAPLLVEIGFGNGQFLIDLATTRPEANILGIEISQVSLRKAARRARERELANVSLLYGNAVAALWALCLPRSLAEVYVNFPDPWPKASHHHRRLLNPRFLELLASRMPPGATLDIATDHDAYAEAIAQHLRSASHFDSRLPQTFVTDDPARLRTKYEQIALAEGRTCRYFKWERNATPAVAAFPIPLEMPMPHVIMHTPLSLDTIEEQLELTTHADNGHAVRFVGLLRSRERDLLLVDTYVEEDPVTQRVGLTIRQRAAGEIILGLHEIGFPRPTAAIHRSLDYLSQSLLVLDPGMRVIQSNLKRD